MVKIEFFCYFSLNKAASQFKKYLRAEKTISMIRQCLNPSPSMSERKNRYAVRALPLRPKGRSFTALVDKNLSADEKDYFKLELLERNNCWNNNLS